MKQRIKDRTRQDEFAWYFYNFFLHRKWLCRGNKWGLNFCHSKDFWQIKQAIWSLIQFKIVARLNSSLRQFMFEVTRVRAECGWMLSSCIFIGLPLMAFALLSLQQLRCTPNRMWKTWTKSRSSNTMKKETNGWTRLSKTLMAGSLACRAKCRQISSEGLVIFVNKTFFVIIHWYHSQITYPIWVISD